MMTGPKNDLTNKKNEDEYGSLLYLKQRCEFVYEMTRFEDTQYWIGSQIVL